MSENSEKEEQMNDSREAAVKRQLLQQIEDDHFIIEGLRDKENKDAELTARLKDFVGWCMGVSWECMHGPDACDLQEKAEELELIELRPIPPEDSIDDETEHYFPVWSLPTEYQLGTDWGKK